MISLVGSTDSLDGCVRGSDDLCVWCVGSTGDQKFAVGDSGCALAVSYNCRGTKKFEGEIGASTGDLKYDWCVGADRFPSQVTHSDPRTPVPA